MLTRVRDVYGVAVECVYFSSLFICSAWHFIFSLEDVEGFFACFIIIKFNVEIMGFGVGRKLEDTRGSANVTRISPYPRPNEIARYICAAYNDALDAADQMKTTSHNVVCNMTKTKNII